MSAVMGSVESAVGEISPLARIELTRARLRAAMMPPPPKPKGTPRAASMFSAERIKHLPVIGTVIEALQAWWFNHPLRPMASVAVEASSALVEPVATRHPLALVGGAALFGAALVWSKPWRWMFGSALFAGLVPQVASRVVSNLPVESWMTMLGTALAQPPARKPDMQTQGASTAPSRAT